MYIYKQFFDFFFIVLQRKRPHLRVHSGSWLEFVMFILSASSSLLWPSVMAFFSRYWLSKLMRYMCYAFCTCCVLRFVCCLLHVACVTLCRMCVTRAVRTAYYACCVLRVLHYVVCVLRVLRVLRITRFTRVTRVKCVTCIYVST